MTAGDLAAVLVSAVAVTAVVVLALVMQSMLRTLRELRAALDELTRETLPMLGELRDTVREAGAEVERVDHLLEAAESISATVDSASRLGYLAFRAPLIRVVAFWRGFGRFVRRLLGAGARPRRAGRGAEPGRRAA